MKISARLTIILTLLCVLSLGAVADAHVLKVSRVAKANRTFAKLVCSATNDPDGVCVASNSGGCKRISDHRVRCLIFITVEAEDKSRGRCRGLMEWTIRPRSGALRPNFLGYKRCVEVRGPQVEPLP